MKRLLFLPCLIVVFLLTPGWSQAADSSQLITLRIPGPVLAQAVNKMVPFDLNVSSKILKGAVSITDITNIELKNQQISCRLGLVAKKLRLVTEISGHKINLNVGSVRLDFQADARLRFDSDKQLLYIRPILRKRTNTKPQKADIAAALLAIISGRDFPVSIKKLKPLIADTNNKSIMISMKIRNIEAVNNSLLVSITPSVRPIPSSLSQKP